MDTSVHTLAHASATLRLATFRELPVGVRATGEVEARLDFDLATS